MGQALTFEQRCFLPSEVDATDPDGFGFLSFFLGKEMLWNRESYELAKQTWLTQIEEEQADFNLLCFIFYNVGRRTRDDVGNHCIFEPHAKKKLSSQQKRSFRSSYKGKVMKTLAVHLRKRLLKEEDQEIRMEHKRTLEYYIKMFIVTF